MQRYCNGCHKTHDISNFHKNITKPGGYARECKDCRRIMRREWQQKNRVRYNKWKKGLREEKKNNGICVSCLVSPIDFHNSTCLCAECLKYKREKNLIYKANNISKGICPECGKNKINFNRSIRYCNKCLDRRNYYDKYLRRNNGINIREEINEIKKYLEGLNEESRDRTTIKEDGIVHSG